MKKSESLIRLKNMGLNTSDFTIIESEDVLTKFCETNPVPSTGWSIRSEKGEGFKLPFFQKLNKDELLLKGKELIREGYKLIVYSTIDSSQCRVKGTAVFFSDTEECLVECILGPGTVRDLEYNKPEAIRLTRFSQGGFPLNIVYRMMRRDFSEKPEVVEWSYYEVPVGRLHENLIVWEVRPWI